MRAVLIVAAHPDDEVLGCGATIARHAASGDRVHILILAEGATARDRVRDTIGRSNELSELRGAAIKAAEILGACAPLFAGLPDNRLDELALLDVVKEVERIVDTVRPEIVYTHHAGDLNVDHRVVHNATITACRPLPGAGWQAIYSFEVASSTEWSSPQNGLQFVPTRYVDVSAVFEKKMLALDAYASEMRPFPHARSVEAIKSMMRLRGSQAGVDYAEAFHVVREVIRLPSSSYSLASTSNR